MTLIRIGLVGDFNPAVIAHRAIPKALQLAGASVGHRLEASWIATDSIEQEVSRYLSDCRAIWCVPNSPYKNMEGALGAIRFARETGRPFLGTCGGFQHALLEYARNVLGLHHADHAETNPDADFVLISPLSCSLVEKSEAIALREGSRLKEIYGVAEIREEYHCNYGLNPQYENLLEGIPLQICGCGMAGEVRAIELTNHPFFFATLFQPERSALQGNVHPLIQAYVEAAAQ
jgi:CTP synthase (UTP-ammonia lyase)